MRVLNAVERKALSDFARVHGSNWKQALRDAWMNASEPGVLQALRNDSGFGPRGLDEFRFGGYAVEMSYPHEEPRVFESGLSKRQAAAKARKMNQLASDVDDGSEPRLVYRVVVENPRKAAPIGGKVQW